MKPLNDSEKQKLVELIQAGKPFPPVWRSRLFEAGDEEFVEATKVYQLVYAGKTPKQAVIGNTPSAPFQEVRSFNADNPFPDRWRNLLIYGDNLLALKTLYDDQRGPNRYGTRNKIKLIYIDPPFATKQDFMKDREKAYRDKVVGAQFIEFLRKRLILMREILADDGSIYVHLDWKKGHYIKAVLDEVFSEECFVGEVVWKRTSSHNDPQRYGNIHDTLFYYSKTGLRVWNPQYQDHDAGYLRKVYVYNDAKGRYRLGDLTAPGISGGVTGKAWRGVHPTSFGRHWRRPPAELEQLLGEGRIQLKKDGIPSINGWKQYLDDTEGMPLMSVWTDLPNVTGISAEKHGYPTQKPETLLSRIIRTSSK